MPRQALAACAALVLAACGSTAAPKQVVYSVNVRAIPVCPASVRAPVEVNAALPSAAAPPTSVLRRGAALSVPVPARAKLGLTGVDTAAERSVLCTVGATAGGSATLLARQLGYVRLAVVLSGATKPRVLFVKVTG